MRLEGAHSYTVSIKNYKYVKDQVNFMMDVDPFSTRKETVAENWEIFQNYQPQTRLFLRRWK